MSLDITPNPNSFSRLLSILLDPKSFQTALDSITWLPGHVPISIHCRLIIILSIYVWLTLTLAKVCPHSRFITQGWNVYFPCLPLYVNTIYHWKQFQNSIVLSSYLLKNVLISLDIAINCCWYKYRWIEKKILHE